MGIIAWIVLGLASGLLANFLVPGGRSQGLVLTCLIGIAGALGGGWAATRLFHVHTLHGFFNLSTGSPPSPARPSCCSPTTWSPGRLAGPVGPVGPADAAGSRIAEDSGVLARPW